MFSCRARSVKSTADARHVESGDRVASKGRIQDTLRTPVPWPLVFVAWEAESGQHLTGMALLVKRSH